jgi:hypothetical protein
MITVDPARPTRIVAKRRYFVASGDAREVRAAIVPRLKRFSTLSNHL